MSTIKSHTSNVIKNSLFGIASSFIMLVLNFVVRVVLVKGLGDEINGIQSLFQNIINVMLLMELGISSAMIIHLYEPVKLKDEKLVSSIMAYYRKIYIYLSVIFTLVNIIFGFFVLDNFVKSSLPENEVRIYFFIFSLSFTGNYLTYYKRSLLFAEAKNRVSIFVTSVCELIFRGMQIFVIIYFKNYYIFLSLAILEKLTSNIICNIYVNKNHPYLKNKAEELSKEKKGRIFATVKPLLVSQVAGTVQQSSRSLLIGFLLGDISVVGYYGNYQLIISAVELIYSQFGGAFTTSFGNLSVGRNIERMENAFKKASLAMNLMATVICCAFLACASDFMFLIFGKNFVLPELSVIVLSINMLIYLYIIPGISVQNALGLHIVDAKYMAVQALLSVVLGLLFGYIFGLVGIFIGVLIPQAAFSLLLKGLKVSKAAFNMPYKSYIRFLFLDITKAIAALSISYVFTGHILKLSPSILGIIIKGISSAVISLAVFITMSLKSPILKPMLLSLKNFVKRH